MNDIRIINNNEVSFTKGYWSDDEIMTAKCCGLTLSGNTFTADIRVVDKRPLFLFMKKSFSHFLMSDSTKGKRQSIFSGLKNMYDEKHKFFMENFFSRCGYDKTLYGHQEEALSLMVNRKCNLLSFEQGLGKTITSATMSKILSVKRTIVVCPSLVKWNWFRNMTDDWGYNELYWSIYDRRNAQSIKAFKERFVVINFEMINKFFDDITKDECGHIIIDECQYIKNHQSGRYKAVEKLVKRYPNAKITLLSGTPITNRINDLFAYLKLCGHPLGKNYSFFKSRYTITSSTRGGKKIIGSKNVEELKERISNFMIRKKTEECVDLPDLVINKYFIDAEDIRDAYNRELEDLYSNQQALDNSNSKEDKFKAKSRMNANLHSLNRMLATSKIETISKLINKIRDEGRKVIVFSGYKDALNGLEAIYRSKCVKIDGSVSAHKRDALITRFKEEDDCYVFLGNFKAAGVGINLVNASDVIFMNFPFTPDDLEQPYKRAHRIGQKEIVNVYYTICKETIDENIFNIISDKTRDINELIDSDKKGVINYDSIPNMIFRDLLKKKGITPKDSFVNV